MAAAGLLGGGCFNPPTQDDTTTDGSTGPSTTTGVDGSSGPPPDTTTSVDGTTTLPPETTTGMDTSTTDGGSSSSESTGEPLVPDIQVSVAGRLLESGDTVIIPDTVNVGSQGTPITVTVENVGEEVLNLSGLIPGGPDVNHFLVDIMGANPMLGVGESTSFDLRFTPVNGGIKNLLVSIGSDDPDEDPFDLVFSGHTTPNRYRPITTMGSPSARFNHAMAPTEDGRVVLFGGRDATETRLNDTWILDVETATWAPVMTVPSPSPRDAHEMAYVGNDTIVMFGGNDVQGGGATGLGDTWLFDVATEQWSPVMTPSPGPRFQHMMASLGTEVIMFGGRTMGNELGDTWLFDGMAGTWMNLSPGGTNPLARMSAAMAFDGNDTVVLYGGFANGGDPQPDTFEYTVSTNTWALGTPGGVVGDRAVLEGDFLDAGRMIVFSGKLAFCCDDPDPGTFAYDIVTDSWADLMPPMEPIPRFNYGMVALPGRNKLIVFGGQLTNIGSEDSVNDTFEYVGPRPQ